MREWLTRRKWETSDPSVSSALMAWISARGTITSSMCFSLSCRTFCRMARSGAEKSALSPLASLSSATSRSSRSETVRSARRPLIRCQSVGPRLSAGAGLDGGSVDGARFSGFPVGDASLSVIVAAGRPASPLIWRPQKLPVCIGVGNAQGGKDPGFEAFHLKSLSFLNVVVTQKMQEAVHREMGKMLYKSNPLLLGFAHQRLVG